jgi:hypothetical protein
MRVDAINQTDALANFADIDGECFGNVAFTDALFNGFDYHAMLLNR